MKYYSILNHDKSYIPKFGEIANGVIIEKKSKFYSYIFKVNSEEEAINYINIIKDNNKEARHVVYIYSLLQNNVCNIRFSDDGEPKGTGTKAIYELLTKEAITNICIIIVRYFGGILLGAGPLSRTYLNTARKALDICTKKEIYHYIDYDFSVTYSKYTQIKPIIDKYIIDETIILKDIQFNENVDISIKIRDLMYQTVVNQI
ncbi:MAG: YigZ family protein [Clostridia bacterium]|nr:YigZ family protein [Clostridia bacterium]